MGGLPSGAREPPGGLNRATEDDELHTVNHRGPADAADEGLHERFECVHGNVIKFGGLTKPKQRLREVKIWWYEAKRRMGAEEEEDRATKALGRTRQWGVY